MFPLKDAPFFKQVKEGKLDYSAEVVPVLESLTDEVEKLVSESSLPERVDIEYWNRFLCEILEKERFFEPLKANERDNIKESQSTSDAHWRFR